MTGMLVLALQTVAGQDTGKGAQSADAHLLQAAARRDQSAFEQIIKRHYQVVYRVVWRLLKGHRDAEDLAQEAFLRLWQNPSQIRNPDGLRSWLVRTASNLANDRFRARPLLDIEHAEHVADGALPPDGQMDHTWVTTRMDEAIATLPERQKLALLLVQFEHMSNRAAAEVMEISVDALESLLSRARRNLKEALAGEWHMMLQTLAQKD
jgi:RNA polymerase sigma-70 factor, ECF subfamily